MTPRLTFERFWCILFEILSKSFKVFIHLEAIASMFKQNHELTKLTQLHTIRMTVETKWNTNYSERTIIALILTKIISKLSFNFAQFQNINKQEAYAKCNENNPANMKRYCIFVMTTRKAEMEKLNSRATRQFHIWKQKRREKLAAIQEFLTVIG